MAATDFFGGDQKLILVAAYSREEKEKEMAERHWFSTVKRFLCTKERKR